MHSLRTLMSKLHPTSFNNKLSRDNMIKNAQASILKRRRKRREMKGNENYKRKRKIKQEQ